MLKRAKIFPCLLGLMILAIVPAACGGGSSQRAATAATTGTPAVGQEASPATTPIRVATATPAASTPTASPTTAEQAATPIATPKATSATTPAATPTAPPVAAGTPAALSSGNVVLNDSWFTSSSVGWLAGRGCVQVKPGTSSGKPPVMQCTGVIYHTIDGGKHWLSLDTGKLIPCKIEFTSDKTGWLIGVKNGQNGYCSGDTSGTGVIQQTSDGGASWTTRYLPSGPGILPTDLSFTSNDQGWVTLSDCPSEESPCSWQVISTTDAGRNWNTTTVPITAHQASLAHPDANDGWVIAGGDNLVNIADSHDGGRTWQLRSIPARLGGWQATIFFLNAQQGWFLTGGEPGAGQEFKDLYGTTDGGRTWSLVAGPSIKPLAPGPLGSSGYVGPLAFATPNDGWIALQRGGVWQTTDGGKHWSPIKAIPPEPSPQDVEFDGAQLGWATGLRYVMLTGNGGASWQAVPLPPSFPPEPGIPPNYQPPG